MVKLFRAFSAQEIEDKVNDFIKHNYNYVIDNLRVYPITTNQRINPEYVAYIEYCRNREEEFNLWKK